MTVQRILDRKGTSVETATADLTISDAAKTLRAKRIGALVISRDGVTIDGILSERDIVHAIAEQGIDVMSKTVGEVMTRTVITCVRTDKVGDVMTRMTERRFRHLPVVDNGRLCGMVSIGDLVKERLAQVESEAEALRSFITQ